MFEFDFSDSLKKKVEKIAKKSPQLTKIINKKVKQIINNNLETIDRYKNLRHDLKDQKRVQIGHFVLTFKIYKNENFILFLDYDHHDNIY
jgi:mRNA-degrading endonuclease RelE of RelBE toxin-antitoxin system